MRLRICKSCACREFVCLKIKLPSTWLPLDAVPLCIWKRQFCQGCHLYEKFVQLVEAGGYPHRLKKALGQNYV
jgi:hypothetical protein